MSTFPNLRNTPLFAGGLALCIAAMLSACGGSNSDQAASDGTQGSAETSAAAASVLATEPAVIATATTTLDVETENLPESVAEQIVGDGQRPDRPGLGADELVNGIGDGFE
jgi:hypothetical protein